jgi:Tol biopolymer transport system component
MMRAMSTRSRLLLLGLATGLLAGSAQHVQAAFPGANGLIAFSSTRDANAEIYVMEPDASDPRRLTRNPGADTDPAWSPDGTRIAFTSNRDGNDEIYVMSADGSGQTRLTTSPGSDSNPAWSPGGRNIVFASRRDGQAEIYVMNEDGTGQSRLTTNSAPDAVPAWSPDGTKIAFTSARDGQDEIYVMNVDGSNQTRLTMDPGSDVSPAWSADGEQIAFASKRDGNYEIYVMNADGSDQRRLTRNLETDLDPGWSPDDTQVTFTSNRDSNYEIYKMDADGTAQARLTTNAAPDTTPDWQPRLIRYVVGQQSFRGRWRESEYRGALVVDGRVDAPLKAAVTLRRTDRRLLTGTLDLVPGVFHRELAVPKGLLPGAYALDVEPDPTSGFAEQHLSVQLKAPPEGVVSRAWASRTLGGGALSRLPSRTSIVYANFRLAAKPNPSLRLALACYQPNGKLVGNPARKPATALVVGGVRTTGRALPNGRWQCVLSAGATVVKRLRFRIG